MSLLNTFQGLLTGGVVDKLASLVGGNSSLIRTGLGSALPSLMKGIISKGSTSAGAGQLLNLIKDNNLSADMTPDASLMDKGSKINEAIFGGSLKDINIPGVSGDQKSKLMNAATPLMMGSLGKVIKDKNLDAAGLSSYLNDQKAHLGAAASSGAKAVTETRERVVHREEERSGGGLGFLKFLLPLLLIGAAIWWFMGRGSSTETTTTDNVETAATTTTQNAASTTKATHTHADGTVHEGHSHGNEASSTTSTSTTSTSTTATNAAAGAATAAMGISLDEEGNLLKDGKIYLKKGEFTIKDGEYFDAEGKSLGFMGKVGKAIGDAGKAVGGAVAGAADKTADFFSNTFGSMFKKKSAGAAVPAYSLSKIVFNPESHKITSFSKNEVEGLASALKAYPDSKITVQASGVDKKTNKLRAKVIHDMLVTLGVSDKQIDAESSDAAGEAYSIMIK